MNIIFSGNYVGPTPWSDDLTSVYTPNLALILSCSLRASQTHFIEHPSKPRGPKGDPPQTQGEEQDPEERSCVQGWFAGPSLLNQ